MANKGGWKFRKPRGSRACAVCRLRKVRCDAETQMPCSNCISFGSDCRFPEPRRKKASNNITSAPQAASLPVQVGNLNNDLPVSHNFGNSIPTNYTAIALNNSYTEGSQAPIQHDFQLSQINHSNHINENQNQQTVPQQVQQYSQMHGFQQIQPQFLNGTMLSMHQNQQYTPNTNQQYVPFLTNQQYVPRRSTQQYVLPQSNQLQDQPQMHNVNTHEITNGTPYIPNDPIANISVRNIMPQYNPSNTNTPSNNGVKVAQNRRLSKFLYFGPTSCYSYFVDYENSKRMEGKTDQDIADIGYSMSSNIDPEEILTEIQVLNIRSAFKLPSRPIMLSLFEAFFDNIYLLIPLINKDIFMKHFNDPNPDKQPPIVLIQALLLAGSRYSQHPAIVDSKNDSSAASYSFYQRVKSLYDSSVKFEYIGDSNDEDDGHLAFNYPTVLVQVSCLLSWHWVHPEDASRGIYFWIRNAITIAQTFGFHRNMEDTYFVRHLLHRFKDNELQKYKISQQLFYWKKIWWWLFCRDRSAAMSFGRPLAINLHESACEIPNIQDFANYESGSWSIDNKEDKLLAEFHIHSIFLSEVVGLVIHEKYLTKRARNLDASASRNSKVVNQLNLLMGIFFNNLPDELKFTANEPKTMNVYSCLLGALYYITLFHINRVKLVTTQDSQANNKYWGISFQAAYMTSLMAQYLGDRVSSGERLVLSPQLVYTMSMAMIILSFHTDSTNKIVSRTASRQMNICLNFSRQCHAVWPGVTYLLITFFTERLNNADKRDELIARAKSILLKLCQEYILDEDKGKSDHLKNLKSFDLNLLLNDADAYSVSDTSSNDFCDWDKNEEDLSLPIFNIVTIELPPPESKFCKSFNATRLFPESKTDYNISLTPRPVQLSPSTNGNQQPLNPQSNQSNVNLHSQNDAIHAPRTNANTRIPEQPLFTEGFPNGFVANSGASTNTPVQSSAASFGNGNIPLYPTAPDPVYPFPTPAPQPTSLDFQENSVLDSQYFLNVNSGVNWNTYNM